MITASTRATLWHALVVVILKESKTTINKPSYRGNILVVILVLVARFTINVLGYEAIYYYKLLRGRNRVKCPPGFSNTRCGVLIRSATFKSHTVFITSLRA